MKTIPIALSAMILAGCASAPPATKTERLLAVVRAVGDPLVMAYGYGLVEKNAPELIPLLDGTGDKVLTIAEVEAAATQIDEATAAVLLVQVAARLVAKE